MNKNIDKNIFYYGSEKGLPEKVNLKAGQLDLVYENGFLRYIRSGDVEILRMINHAVRDHNWGTPPLNIIKEKIDKKAHSFYIEYTALIDHHDIRFEWNCRISGSEENVIEFTIEGTPLSTFKRNRIGFTVLHPVKECAGQEVSIIHPDGSSDTHLFPEMISPDQPFLNISAMEWKANNISARLSFSGDVFETEDQRNWIDDSYKTYCTPLELPFPVTVNKGERIKQGIILSVNVPEEATRKDAELPSVSIDESPCDLPAIGVGQSSEVKELSHDEVETIRKAGFDHYRADLLLYDSHWPIQLDRIIKESKSLKLPVELSMFFDHVKDELIAFTKLHEQKSIRVSYINIFNRSPHATQKKTLDVVVPEIRRLFPEARIGAGTDAFFTELNRDRTPVENLDFLVYSINPQVHAIDNATLCENLSTIPYTIKSAKEFGKNKAVHISPVTFKMRWNPNATGKVSEDKDQLPDDVDARQMSLFGASWVVGAINQMIRENPEAVTFFETVGLKGIMQSSSPQCPDLFFAPSRRVYPMYLIFKMILGNKHNRFFQVNSQRPLEFSGLSWGNSRPEKLLLVSYQPDKMRIALPDFFINGFAQAIHVDNIGDLLQHPDMGNLSGEIITGNSVEIPPFGILLLRTSEPAN